MRFALALIVSLFVADVYGASLTESQLRTIDRGELRSDGLPLGHHAGARFSVGRHAAGLEIRNYFSFNLAGITETIASAELLVSPAWLYSPDAFETFELHQMTSVTFDDAGDGPTYYSGDFPGVNNGVRMPLNEAALADLNAARGGLFTMGGRLASLSHADDEILFSGYFEPTAYMLIQTHAPEPGTWAMMLLGLPAAIWIRRRATTSPACRLVR
jgi:hypothetical protein